MYISKWQIRMLLEFFSLHIMHADSNTSLTAVGRSWGTGTVMVGTQGWRRALPSVCLLPHRWVTLHQRASIFQMSSWCYEMWVHLPRSEISELLFLLMTHSAFHLTTAKYCLFPFRSLSSCLCSLWCLEPACCPPRDRTLEHSQHWNHGRYLLQDEAESSNSLLGNCFHILAPPSRLYKTLLPWSLPTNGSWTVQLTAGEQAKQKTSGYIQELQSPCKWLPPTWSSQPLLPTFSNVMWAC